MVSMDSSAVGNKVFNPSYFCIVQYREYLRLYIYLSCVVPPVKAHLIQCCKDNPMSLG